MFTSKPIFHYFTQVVDLNSLIFPLYYIQYFMVFLCIMCVRRSMLDA